MDIIVRQKLSLLINLARADGHFAPEEKDLITQIGLSKGLSKNEISGLIERPDKIESLGALSRSRKKEYLIDSIKLMLADGKIEESERNFCRNIAVKLRYDKDIVDFLINNWSSDVESIDLSEFELPNF
jgi:uncharacterized tellurite resistance protein B-like protein